MLEKPVESVALHILSEMAYRIKSYPQLLSETDIPEVLHLETLRGKLAQFNPGLPAESIEEAIRILRLTEHPTLIRNNQANHRHLVEGVPVRYRKDGRIRDDHARLIDFDFPENNDFQAVSQMTVIEGQHVRRPDIVIYVNGLPLAVIEIKNPSDENATIWSAYNQLQTYISQIPSLFLHNALLVITDGLEARVGTLSSGREWMMPWRTISGEEIEANTLSQMEVLLKGIFEPMHFINIIRHFIVFEKARDRLIKKLAGYHQFHAVNVAVEKTVQAISIDGDKRCGVVWHTQGSGNER
jgi:type I restriction enzyme, R subunit